MVDVITRDARARVRKAPKKYLDPDQIEVNPAWLEWREEFRVAAKEAALDHMYFLGMDPALFFPEDYDKGLGEDGRWIMVVEEPHTELLSRFRLPLLSMWFATPKQMHSNVGPFHAIHAVIQTPGGELHLLPHEYVVVEDVTQYVGEPGCDIHSLGGQALIDEEMLFYLQARGYTSQEAHLALIGQVQQSDFVYFTFDETIVSTMMPVVQMLQRSAS